MKNMTKSMKIALVSAISLVCVVAISLGCVLGLRKNNNNNPPAAPVLTWSQKVDLLGSEVLEANNKKNNIEIINNTISYEGAYNEEEEILTHVGQNYFVVQNISSSEKNVYFCKKDSLGNINVVSATNTKENGGYAESDNGTCKVVDINDEYLVLQYASEFTEENPLYNVIYTVVDLKTQEVVLTKVFENMDPSTSFNGFKFSENGKSALMMLTNKSEDNLEKNTAYYFNFVESSVYTLNSFNVQTETGDEPSEEDRETVRVFSENDYYLQNFNSSVMFAQSGNVKVFINNNGKMYESSFELGENNRVYSSKQITNNQVVVELQKVVIDGTNEETGKPNEIITYSYKLFTLKNNEITQSNFELKEGQSKLEFEPVSDSFYLTRAYGVDEVGEIETSKFTLSYYYKDNGLVFEVESNNNYEKVLNAKSGKLLTTLGLYQFEDATTVEKLCEFGQYTTLFSDKSVSDNFYVASYSKDNKTYSFKYFDLNIDDVVSDLEFAYGEGEDKHIFSPTGAYSDGTNFILKSNEGYFRLNNDTHTFTQIDRFYDEDEKMNFLLSNGLKVYFEKNDDLSLKLNHLSGETIFDNISAYNFVRDIEKGLLLELISNGETKTIYLNVNYNLSTVNEAASKSDTEPFSIDNVVEPYENELKIYYRQSYSTSYNKTQTVGWYWSWFVVYRDVTIWGRDSIYEDYGWNYNFCYWCTSDTGTYQSYYAGQSWTETAWDYKEIYCYAVMQRSVTILVTPSSTTFSRYTWNQKGNVWWHDTASTPTSSYSTPSYNGWYYYGFGYNTGRSTYSVSWTGSTYINPSWYTTGEIQEVMYQNMYIAYRGNGNTGGSMSSPKSITIYFSYYHSSPYVARSYIYPGSNGYTKTGYTFNKWQYSTDDYYYYDACSSGGSFIHPYTDDNDPTYIYIRATWTPNKYYFVLNANGGTFSSPSAGSNATLESSSSYKFSTHYDKTATFYVYVKRTGYYFSGWGNSKTTYSFTNTYSTTDSEQVTSTAKNLKTGSSSSSDYVTIYAQWTPITYYISLNPGDGSDNDGSITSRANVSGTTVSGTTITATYNTTAKFSASVKRPGYKFAGWVTTDGGSTAFSSSKISDTSYSTINDTTQYRSVTTTALNLTSTRYETVTLYAKWTKITFTTQFDANGGTFSNSNSVSTTFNGSDLSKEIKKKGYLFSGWTLSGNGAVSSSIAGSYTHKDETNSYITVTTTSKLCYTHGSTVTLKAKWTALTITIQLDANGGTISDAKYSNGTAASSNKFTFSYDTVNTFTNNIVKTGYRFNGWEISNATNNGNITYINTNNQSSNKATYTLVDQSTTPIAISTQTKNITSNKATVTFKARWIPITYYIQYVKNKPAKASETVMLGSSTTNLISNTEVQYGVSEAISSSYYSLKGWTQIGWSTSSTATSADYVAGGSYDHKLTTVHSSTVKYYAVWQQNKYKVTLNANGTGAEIKGLTAVTTSTIYDLNATTNVFYLKYDDDATFTVDIKRPGYMFAGWTLESSSSDTGVVNPKPTSTSYASFTAYYNDSSNRETANAINVTTEILNVNSTAGGESTLKAKWTSITYYVSLASNSTEATISYPTGTAVSGLTYSSKYTIRYDVTGKFKVGVYRVGYQFYGWLSSKGSGVGTIGCYDANDKNAFVPNNDTTQVNTFVTRITNLTTCYLETVTLSVNWERIAYYIKLVAAPGDANVSFDNHAKKDYSDLTAYPKDPNPPAASAFDYTVYYDRNSTFTVDLKRPGYKFKDWKITSTLGSYTIKPSNSSYSSILRYYDANRETANYFNLLTSVYNLTTTAYEIITFTAEWTAITYTITYEPHRPANATYTVQGSVPNSPAIYDVAQDLQTNNYTLIGWTYMGWSRNGDLINPTSTQINNEIYASGQNGTYNFTTIDKNTVVLYAIWRQNVYYLNYTLDNINSYTGTAEDQNTGEVHTTTFKFDDPFREVSIPTKVGYTFVRYEITGMSNNNTKFWGTSNTASFTAAGTTVDEDVTTLRLDNPASNKSNPNAHPNGNSSTPSTTTTIQDFFFKNLSSVDGSTVNIKAIWTKNTYNLRYEYTSGSPDPRGLYPSYAIYDEAFTVTYPVRFGYTFTGWNITGMGWSGADACTHTTKCTHILGSTPTTNATASKVLETKFKNLNCHQDSTVTLTATWRQNEYNINYVIDSAKGEYKVSGKSYPDKLKYDSWSKIDNPARMGYTFTGWIISGMSLTCDHLYNTADSTTGAHVTALDLVSIENISINHFLNLHSEDKATVTFTPTWIPNIYKIQYIVNYEIDIDDGYRQYELEGALGSNGRYPSTATYDEPFYVDAPGVAPFGYYFDGWIISGMNNNKITELNASCKHYYGTSEDNVKNKNTTNATMTVGKEYTTFMNLHSETGSTVTFKANWKPNRYNIDYVYSDRKGNDATPANPEVTSVLFNEKFTIGVPERPGYTFVGWNLDFLSDECPHYYFTTTSNSSEVEFESYENGYYDIENNNPTIFVNVQAVSFMNLHCEMGATVVLTAKWLANDYKVTYHYMDYDMSSITESKLNAVGGNPEYYTENRTIEYKYDSIFKTLDVAKSANDTNGVMVPNNVKILYWMFFSKTVGSTGCTPSISYTNGKGYVLATMDANKVVTPVSGTYCFSPGTEYVFNSSKNFSFAELFGNNEDPNYVIHAYAVYGYVDVTVKLYGVGSAASDKLEYNNIASYIELSSSIPGKVGQEYTVPNTVNSQPIKGYMISTNFYNYGELTANSISSYVYSGTTYTAAAGETIKWHLPTSAAQDPNNPTFYVYVVYDVIDKNQLGVSYDNTNHYIQFNTGTKFEAGKEYTITIRGLDETSYFDYEYVKLAKTFDSTGTDRVFEKVYAHTGAKENCKGTVTTKVNSSKDTLSITFTADSSTAAANLFLVFDGTLTLNEDFIKNIDIVIIQNP